MRAMNEGRVAAEVEYLLRAEEWSAAHRIITTRVAPTLVIQGQHDALRSLLQRIDATQVQHWQHGAQLFLDYLDTLGFISTYSGTVPQQPPATGLSDSSEQLPMETMHAQLVEQLHSILARLPLLRSFATASPLLTELRGGASCAPTASLPGAGGDPLARLDLHVCIADMASVVTSLLQNLDVTQAYHVQSSMMTSRIVLFCCIWCFLTGFGPVLLDERAYAPRPAPGPCAPAGRQHADGPDYRRCLLVYPHPWM